FGALGRRQHADARGGQLQGQRIPVQPAADVDDGRGVPRRPGRIVHRQGRVAGRGRVGAGREPSRLGRRRRVVRAVLRRRVLEQRVRANVQAPGELFVLTATLRASAYLRGEFIREAPFRVIGSGWFEHGAGPGDTGLHGPARAGGLRG